MSVMKYFSGSISVEVDGLEKSTTVSGLLTDQDLLIDVAVLYLNARYEEILMLSDFERYLEILSDVGNGTLLPEKVRMYSDILQGLSLRYFHSPTLGSTFELISAYRALKKYLDEGGDDFYQSASFDSDVFEFVDLSELDALTAAECDAMLNEDSIWDDFQFDATDDELDEVPQTVFAAVEVSPTPVITTFFLDHTPTVLKLLGDYVLDCRGMGKTYFFFVIRTLKKYGSPGDHYTLIVNDFNKFGRPDLAISYLSHFSETFCEDFWSLRSAKFYQLLLASSVCSHYGSSFEKYRSYVEDVVYSREFLVGPCSHVTPYDPFPHGFCYLNFYKTSCWSSVIQELPDGFATAEQLFSFSRHFDDDRSLSCSLGKVSHLSLATPGSALSVRDVFGRVRASETFASRMFGHHRSTMKRASRPYTRTELGVNPLVRGDASAFLSFTFSLKVFFSFVVFVYVFFFVYFSAEVPSFYE